MESPSGAYTVTTYRLSLMLCIRLPILIHRMPKMIEKINKAKQELRKEIMSKGYKTPNGKVIPLQYYAH